MNKKFIYFKTKTQFTAKLSSLPSNAIVFIEDTKQIWTHGVFFDTSWDYVTGKPNTFTPSAHTLGSHSDVTLAALANGNILRYDGSKWVNNTLAQAGIATPTDITNAISAIEIGGRNLISTLPSNWQQGSFSGGSLNIINSYKSRILTTDIEVSPNTQYIINLKDGYEVWIPELDENKSGVARTHVVFWSSRTFTTTSNTKYLYVSMRKTGTSYNSTNPEDFLSPSDISDVNIKLEKGTIATDWTPAPEDQVSDWSTTDVTSFSYIKNKPTLLSQFTDNIGVATHIANKANPHEVTTSQIGAVDLTSNQSIGGVKTFTSNVGIGTTNPLQKLSVTNTFAITNTSGSQYLLMGNQDSDGVNKPAVIHSANSKLNFGYGSSWSGSGGIVTSVLSISGNNVGIGTTNPLYKLDVAGIGRFTGNVTAPSFIGNASTASKVLGTVAGTGTLELVRGTMADNDHFRILIGGTASNAGYVEIATGDDASEPIYVRQYKGQFTTLTRTAALLDGAGNTSFPGTVTAPTFIGALSGNATSATLASTLTINSSASASWFDILWNSGTTVYGAASNKLRVQPSTGSITSGGTITASGGNSNQWNSAYGWGNFRQFGLGAYVIGATTFNALPNTSGFYFVNGESLFGGVMHKVINLGNPNNSNLISQIAVQHSGATGIASQRMYFRMNQNSNWAELYHTGNFTPSDYVKKSGDTMSGGLTFTNGQVILNQVSETAWPNSTNSNANNFINRARLSVNIGNNGLHFFGDGATNARRFGIQSGHKSPLYTNGVYGILELNPFGGRVKVGSGGIESIGEVSATTFIGDLSGNATTATELQTVRAINGTNFNGLADITTARWGTARTLTIGSTGKSVNGSADVSWTLAEIGAAVGDNVSYTHNAGSGARWIRIAEFSHYTSYGIISILNNFHNNSPNSVSFYYNSGYRSVTSPSITQIGGRAGIFTKARVVYPTTTNVPGFIEVYYNTTSVGNTLYLRLANSFNCKLLRTATVGAVPSTHTSYERSFTDGGISADTVSANTFYGSLSGNASSATNLSRSIIAGNGLTGGGNLTADRTITLGTPSNITATSTNSVTATSHTHNLVMGSGSGLDADLLDGHHASETAATGLLYTYREPNIENTQSWYKLGTLTTPAVTGSGSSKVVAQITGLANFGSNEHRILILKASTRGSISVNGLMIKGNSTNVRVGYVNNGSNIEIWVGYAGAYNTATNIQILNSNNFTVNRGRVNSMPTGFVTGPISISATTDSNVASATTASNVALANRTTNASHYISFSANATGNGPLYTNAGLTFNPSTKSLSIGGNLIATGEITAHSSSDIRLKDNIKSINNPLAIINQLDPVTYNWNDKAIELNGIKTKEKKDYGLIAQDVEKIIPEVVGDMYDGEYKGIDYVKLVPILIGAVKELTEKVEELENQLKE